MRVIVGDITKVENVDVIVNAANGIGVMGAGVAGAIARSGGDLLKQDVKRVVEEQGPFQRGDLYISDAGLLKRRGIKQVYHAVTMQFPGGSTTLGTIASLLTRVLETAISNGVESIAFGGLGTGIGGLLKEDVAKQMANISQSYAGRIKILVIDINKDFIDYFKNSLSIKYET
jgi:O-acetyl-ADP-ribose deacetylase (regulator of RNase III)